MIAFKLHAAEVSALKPNGSTELELHAARSIAGPSAACTAACQFVAPTLQLLTATSVRHGSTCHFGSLWLSSFLPSLMFKDSLQLWCFFGVGGSAFTLPALARTASRCAAFKRERERERLVRSVVNIPNVFKLS